jgi:hypothetical protein
MGGIDWHEWRIALIYVIERHIPIREKCDLSSDLACHFSLALD